MKTYKNGVVLSLVLAGSIASCSAGIDLASLQDFLNSKEEETVQRREKMKKVAIISSATAAAILTVYLFDKYGMKKLGKDPFFSNKIDGVFGKIFTGMLGLCGMRKKDAAAPSENSFEDTDETEEERSESTGSSVDEGVVSEGKPEEDITRL